MNEGELYRVGKLPAKFFFQLCEPEQPIWAFQEQRKRQTVEVPPDAVDAVVAQVIEELIACI